MTVDFYASERHFCDHLAPIWRALPSGLRGSFLVPRSLYGHALGLGLPAVPSQPAGSLPIVVASYGDVRRSRRQGRTRIAFIEHGIGQSYAGDPRTARLESYAGGKDRDRVGLFMVPNDYSAERWRQAYPQASVAIVGCPKLDTAPPYQPDGEPVVAVSFHWKCAISPETGTAFGHFHSALPVLARRFRVIGHGHPRAFQNDRLEARYRRMGIEVVTEFNDVLRRAALYVCDNSSSLYEFAATGRPVVVLNAPAYRRDVHHGLRFWDAADVGIQVDEPSDLVGAVERALLDRPEQRRNREAALGIVYAYRTGGAERAADAIGAWAGASVEVAA